MIALALALFLSLQTVSDRSSLPEFRGEGEGKLVVTEVPHDVSLSLFVVTCERPSDTGCRFTVTRSGEAATPPSAVENTPYKDDGSGVGFRIEPGAAPFAEGDTFTFAAYESEAAVEDLLERWADQYVRWILSREERARFETLEAIADRLGFIESFWMRRDPTAGTPVNEAREEHARRFAYALRRFGAGTPGWATDRGKVYILLGPPSNVERNPSGRTSFERPSEIWTYNDPPNPKLPASMTLTFVDFTATGRYELVSSSNLDIVAPLRTNFGYSLSELDAIGLLRSGGSLLDPNTGLRYPVSPTDLASGQFDFERDLLEVAKVPRLTLPNLREVAAASAAFPSIPVTLETSTFRAAGGRSLVPITLAIPYARLTPESVADGFRYAVDVVVQIDGLPPIEDRLEVTASRQALEGYRESDLLFEASALVPPGSYDVLVTIRDNPSGAVGQTEARIEVTESVEGDAGDGFELSSLLLVSAAFDVPRADGESRAPFQFGATRLVPNPRKRFAKALTAYVEVYGLTEGGRGEAELQVDFFILRDGRLFSKVAPSLHRPGRGGELAIRSDISLVALPPGEYVLRCRVTDRQSSARAERERRFSVAR